MCEETRSGPSVAPWQAPTASRWRVRRRAVRTRSGHASRAVGGRLYVSGSVSVQQLGGREKKKMAAATTVGSAAKPRCEARRGPRTLFGAAPPSGASSLLLLEATCKTRPPTRYPAGRQQRSPPPPPPPRPRPRSARIPGSSQRVCATMACSYCCKRACPARSSAARPLARRARGQAGAACP